MRLGTINTDKNRMKKLTIILTVLIAITIKTNAQIPNSGFENWTTIGSYEDPTGWFDCNFSSSGTFYPVTKSSDHYPISVGNYSIRLENQIPLSNCSSVGFAYTGEGSINSCHPSFPIIGHPTSLCGYYKCFPQNNDTMQIGLMLWQNGIWIACAEFLCTQTVSNWTSFNIPISAYTIADSATITVAAFYNDTTCGTPYGPFGNSVLYIDNINFDNLITSVSEQTSENTAFNLYPNPASDIVTFNTDNINNASLTLNIYNIIGKLIRTETLLKIQKQISVKDLNTGIYMVEIKSADWSKKQKLVIQK